MFVYTAKLNKRKLIIGIVILVIALCAIILLISSNGKTTAASAFDTAVRSNDERISFLTGLGWEVSPEPAEEQTITIPLAFDDVYSEYNKIQLAQGFDLSKYSGLEAVRYTYKVLNHPSGQDVMADIIVYRGRVIAGDIQSTSLNGFMNGLEYPKSLT